MDTISNKHWKKNWSGGWSLLSSYYLGYQYTKQLEEAVGIGLQEALFVTEKGVTSCYFIDEEKEKFGKFFAAQVDADISIATTWANHLKKATDEALFLIKDLLTKPVSNDTFDQYIQVMYAYGVPHRIIKVSVDYFAPDSVEKTLAVLSEARVYAEPVYEYTEKYMKYICENIARNSGISSDLLLAMSVGQFSLYMEKQILPESSALLVQNEIAVLYMKNGNPTYMFGSDAQLIKNALNVNSERTLKGQIAYKGVVRGIVRILSFPPQNERFNEGDILVTGMTRPEYLSYFEKAAGVVTDAGGVLSHAAITARELKKPCIIGTEKATQVLKDGMEVEVDADNGVVRILK